MEDEVIDVSIVDKHVLSDGLGNAIFLFDPQAALVEAPEGGFSLQTDALVIDFLQMLDMLNLDNSIESAAALVTVLLEKRANGELTEYA